MATRKHITELALSFFSNAILILHPKDLDNIEKNHPEHAAIAEDCHIYLIVKRPRVSFVPNSIVVGPTRTNGKLNYRRDGVALETSFFLEGKPNADELRVSPYPHQKLSLIKNGKELTSIPAHLLSLMCDQVDDSAIRDMEVEYVGMAYAEGRRSARDRLLSHSTLQKVLADLNNDAPDDEALIIMAQFEPPKTIISFDGRDKTLKEKDDRDVIADLKKQKDMITEHLQIALIEAGLIRYFQPRYNDVYKKRYPNPSQQILKRVYEIDFGALSVELDTESINVRVFSKTRSVGFHHLASVDLHDNQARRSFFNIMNVEKGYDAKDYSGPVF